MEVENLDIEELPAEEAEPVVQIVGLQPEMLASRGFQVRAVEDPEMGPVLVAAVRDLGSTAVVQRYEWNPEPGYTVSFFQPVPGRDRVRDWLIERLEPNALDLIWLYDGQEVAEHWGTVDDGDDTARRGHRPEPDVGSDAVAARLGMLLGAFHDKERAFRAATPG